MTDPEKKICRYFNTLGGCWYGDSCKFLHIPNKKPPCKFYGSSTGCRYGESCHFSHDRTPFKSVENYNNNPPVEIIKEVLKENVDPSELSGTNNNNMTQPIVNSVEHEITDAVSEANNNYKNDKSITENDDQSAQIVSSTMDSNSNTTEVDNLNVVSTVGNMIINNNTNDINYAKSTVNNSVYYDTVQTKSKDFVLNDASNNNSNNSGLRDSCQNYAITTVSGRSSGMSNEIEIYCGSCRRVLERREGDHVKYVKTKAALEPGQMYWCKSCILIFEKPWSLFQHMADKAKGNKVQRWEKKIHLDWMDSVAGLMAGYDLGLFSPTKLRVDLRNLLADQHTVEEEMEAAAVTAAAMMQWLAPLSSPWRLQQREMMRKIEQLNRQMLRKANLSFNTGSGVYNMRAALPPVPVSACPSPGHTYTSSRNTSVSLPITSMSKQIDNQVNNCGNGDLQTDNSGRNSPTKSISQTSSEHNGAVVSSEINSSVQTEDVNETSNDNNVGPVGDEEYARPESAVSEQSGIDSVATTGASGDIPRKALSNGIKPTPEFDGGSDGTFEVVDSNNTNSACSGNGLNKYDDSGRRGELKRSQTYSTVSNAFNGKISNYSGTSSSKYSGEPLKYHYHGRNSRALSFGHSTLFGAGHRNSHRNINRGGTGLSGTSNRGANAFNPPSFHASLDLNFGFTNDEVEELLSQGIKPWDSEASAALAVLRGELDHLLD
uniref:Helicase ATP-binding domain-containing protein n=1 Tax=Trichobilharzia regenti TaxID=157069 RepID=A0AA85K100_TRIRE|nr:unnamed protein product [Trichobilharzia regenti]